LSGLFCLGFFCLGFFVWAETAAGRQTKSLANLAVVGGLPQRITQRTAPASFQRYVVKQPLQNVYDTFNFFFNAAAIEYQGLSQQTGVFTTEIVLHCVCI